MVACDTISYTAIAHCAVSYDTIRIRYDYTWPNKLSFVLNMILHRYKENYKNVYENCYCSTNKLGQAIRSVGQFNSKIFPDLL